MFGIIIFRMSYPSRPGAFSEPSPASLLAFLCVNSSNCSYCRQTSLIEGIAVIWTGMLRHKSVILAATLLGLILDSTGFAKPKVHAEGRFAS